MRRRVGVIGGTGLYAWPGTEELEVETPYGGVVLHHQRSARRDLFFLPRHGPRHEAPPHRLNYRAHLRALEAARVDWTIGVYNVGGLRSGLRPGDWVVPHDFLDLTKQRPLTFHDEDAVHVDSAEPYCPHLRTALLATGPGAASPVGVYAATEGPRLETAAERLALRVLGADVAGMTGVPEVTLAHEAGLCFAALCIVGNAGGRGAAPQKATTIQAGLARQRRRLFSWIERAVAALPTRKTCRCPKRLLGARLGPAALGGGPR